MNKKFSQILALAVALVMCLLMAMPAMAIKTSTDTDPIIEIPVNLIVTNAETTFNGGTATLTFNVKPADLSALADSTGFKISEGILDDLKISNDNSNYTTASGTLTTTLEITDAKIDEAVKSGTYTEKIYLNFVEVNFTQPGVYRYEISEVCDNEEVVLDVVNPRYIDVYVGYGAGSEILEVQGTILHSVNEEITRNEGGGTSNINPVGKGEGFTNTLDNYTLTITNMVSGNQALRTDEFPYTITITLPDDYAEDVQTFNVRVVNPDADDADKTITVAGGSTTVSHEFTLHHNQSIVIEGLPSGATYTIVENYGDYAPSYNTSDEDGTTVNKDQSAKTYTVTKGGNGISSNTVVRFTNDRTGDIPTGVILTVAPFAALMLLGAAGVVVILKKKSKAM